jgi:PPOX class probable F420-dependent enzyme
LATLNDRGGIDLVPCTFAFLDDSTLVTAVDHKPKTTIALRRLANVGARPGVTVLIDHYDDADWSALWWVRLRGTATVVGDGPQLEAAIDALVARYAQYRERPPDGPAIIVDVADVTSWSARRE